jgi:hypothetical protein
VSFFSARGLLGNEAPYRAVERSFHVIREETGGEFSHGPVVGHAFAAVSFSAAGLIGAVASSHVLLVVLAFLGHRKPPVPQASGLAFLLSFGLDGDL